MPALLLVLQSNMDALEDAGNELMLVDDDEVRRCMVLLCWLCCVVPISCNLDARSRQAPAYLLILQGCTSSRV